MPSFYRILLHKEEEKLLLHKNVIFETLPVRFLAFCLLWYTLIIDKHAIILKQLPYLRLMGECTTSFVCLTPQNKYICNRCCQYGLDNNFFDIINLSSVKVKARWKHLKTSKDSLERTVIFYKPGTMWAFRTFSYLLKLLSMLHLKFITIIKSLWLNQAFWSGPVIVGFIPNWSNPQVWFRRLSIFFPRD